MHKRKVAFGVRLLNHKVIHDVHCKTDGKQLWPEVATDDCIRLPPPEKATTVISDQQQQQVTRFSTALDFTTRIGFLDITTKIKCLRHYLVFHHKLKYLSFIFQKNQSGNYTLLIFLRLNWSGFKVYCKWLQIFSYGNRDRQLIVLPEVRRGLNILRMVTRLLVDPKKMLNILSYYLATNFKIGRKI